MKWIGAQRSEFRNWNSRTAGKQERARRQAGRYRRLLERHESLGSAAGHVQHQGPARQQERSSSQEARSKVTMPTARLESWPVREVKNVLKEG